MSLKPSRELNRPLPGERDWTPERGVVWHWYDFLCPFCYVGQDRTTILRRHGLEVVNLPLQIHPEIPCGGIAAGPRRGAMYERLEQETREAGLELHWPPRLPFSRPALTAAEWVRANEPAAFPALHRALFRAHIVLGENIELNSVIEGHAAASGVLLPRLRAAMADGSAEAALERAESSAHTTWRPRRAGMAHWP